MLAYPWHMKAAFALFLVAVGVSSGQTSAPTPNRRFEISGTAGYGRHTGEEGGKAGVSAFGASLGWRSRSIHGLECGYLYADMKRGTRRYRLVSMSYVVQSRSEPVRPFFQIGVSAGTEKLGPFATGRTSTNSLGGAFVAGGLTVDVRESFFIRPKLSYHVIMGGFSTLIVPSLAAGWKF